MPFIVYTGSTHRTVEPALTVDKASRIYMNAALRDLLGIPKGQPFHALIGYDESNGNIGLAVPGEVKDSGKLMVFDRTRYYATAKGFVSKHAIKPGRYVRIPQNWNGWHQFRREDILNP
ncbi:hypothetical protein [Brevibacillus borstelensis]|uniref:hypothetical protein n=1 Tax=Brevibacillus borstelensis TaxID=45462 RepID=UPI00287F8F9B|nr:hypothetical protein [Brevibacillus borstelensis]WNF07458.1 hypothetical protein RFB14_08655 [Brevibacillus borstelensis]